MANLSETWFKLKENARSRVMIFSTIQENLFSMEKKNDELKKDGKHQNVRRRLFHDEDNNEQSTSHENNNKRIDDGKNDNFANCLIEQNRKEKEIAKKKWNFDFENEVPLPGLYEWKRVTDSDIDSENEEPDTKKKNNEKKE